MPATRDNADGPVMCKKAPEAPKPGSAPCHACLLLADERRDLNARSSWRRICDDCADKFVNKPLPVPVERVRICPDTLGVWGQSREIYQSWDTGLGTVVPARKYNLSPVPDGKVAIVLQDAADAATVDQTEPSCCATARPSNPSARTSASGRRATRAA